MHRSHSKLCALLLASMLLAGLANPAAADGGASDLFDGLRQDALRAGVPVSVPLAMLRAREECGVGAPPLAAEPEALRASVDKLRRHYERHRDWDLAAYAFVAGDDAARLGLAAAWRGERCFVDAVRQWRPQFIAYDEMAPGAVTSSRFREWGYGAPALPPPGPSRISHGTGRWKPVTSSLLPETSLPASVPQSVEPSTAAPSPTSTSDAAKRIMEAPIRPPAASSDSSTSLGRHTTRPPEAHREASPPPPRVATTAAENEYMRLRELALQANRDPRRVGAAADAMRRYIQRHPNHPLAAEARFWIGEYHYQRKEWTDAAMAFGEGAKSHPDAPRAPELMLRFGQSLAQLDRKRDACASLAEVASRYPGVSAELIERAVAERQRLECAKG